MHFGREPQNVHLVGPVALQQVEGNAQTIGCDTCGRQDSAEEGAEALQDPKLLNLILQR